MIFKQTKRFKLIEKTVIIKEVIFFNFNKINLDIGVISYYCNLLLIYNIIYFLRTENYKK